MIVSLIKLEIGNERGRMPDLPQTMTNKENLMRRSWIVLLLLLLLAACGGASPAAPAAEQEQADAASEPAAAADQAPAATGSTPAEAAVVRDTDWAKGASDPAVSIIEYGDFQ